MADYAHGSYSVSRARICGLLNLARSSMYYQAAPKDDACLRVALREKARERKRWGYRRLTVLLRRDGWLDNHKRIERIYREEGLQVPKRKKRKTAYKRKEKPSCPIRMNERWSMDFVHDATVQGRKMRMLNIVDDYGLRRILPLTGDGLLVFLTISLIFAVSPAAWSWIMVRSSEVMYLINGHMKWIFHWISSIQVSLSKMDM